MVMHLCQWKILEQCFNMTKLYGESGRFYREIKIIRSCKVCGVEFRPARYSVAANLWLCIKHRREYQREQAKLYGWKSWSPERKKEEAKKRYPVWLNWVKNHPERRRELALMSYHRRKLDPKNKTRRHRATQNKLG